MSTLKHDEVRSLHAFWNKLTGIELTDEELERMQNPADPPDFQFLYDDARVALEHTQIFRPTSKSSLRPSHDVAIQRRISDHLNRLVKMAKIPSVLLSITFASCRTVKKTDEPMIAQGVLDLVSKRVADGAALPMTLYTRDLSGISPCLGDVLVMQGGSSSTVSRHTGGSVDEWGLASFEKAAREKAGDLPCYKDRFDECWLLLSAGGPHRAQWFEPSSIACSEGIKSDFDRVFVVDHHRSDAKVYELAVTT